MELQGVVYGAQQLHIVWVPYEGRQDSLLVYMLQVDDALYHAVHALQTLHGRDLQTVPAADMPSPSACVRVPVQQGLRTAQLLVSIF